MSLDLAFLAILALAGIWAKHRDRRREIEELAVERGRGFLGQSKQEHSS